MAYHISIELFPAEKSCEQGCNICPMARHERTIIAKKVDENVQATFSFLEAVLKKYNLGYDMHFASAHDLFPLLAHPELIRMARFETNKSVRSNGNADHFSEGIRALLQNNVINPKVIGFSLVPNHPIIAQEDMDVVKNILDSITRWYFIREHKSIEVTLRSNLIPRSLFEEILPRLLPNDTYHLRKLGLVYQDQSLLPKKKRHLFEYGTGRVYVNEYISKIGTKKIILANRIIGVRKDEHIEEKNVSEAIRSIPWNSRHIFDFAIAPKGVMLMHSSLTINNPIMWMSHQDFQKSLELALVTPKKFSLSKFFINIIYKNALLYDHLMEYKNKLKKEGKENLAITEQDFMEFFAEHRHKVESYKRKTNKKPVPK